MFFFSHFHTAISLRRPPLLSPKRERSETLIASASFSYELNHHGILVNHDGATLVTQV
jgi:hypothetical protein